MTKLCGEPGTHGVIQQKLPDGRTVTCIAWDGGNTYAGGLSCDWDGAK